MMLKVEECFGCSLRQGSFLLLSVGLILNCVGIWNYLVDSFVKDNDALVMYFYWYLIVTHIIGVLAFSEGICGIFKNSPQHLNSSYYYLCYTAVFGCILIPLTIIEPSLLRNLRSTKSDSILNYTPIMVMSYLFGIALTVYGAMVMRSLRDTMVGQKSLKAPGDDFKIPTYAFIPLGLPKYLEKL